MGIKLMGKIAMNKNNYSDVSTSCDYGVQVLMSFFKTIRGLELDGNG